MRKPDDAACIVKKIHLEHRMPSLLKLIDRLIRENACHDHGADFA